MMKKKDRLEIARRIISEVNREMQKPRLTESVRNGGKDRATPGVCADAFYEKGSRLDYLVQVVEGMAHQKGPSSLHLPGTSAPGGIPGNGHDSSRDTYVRLTCPECLKEFSKDLDKASCPVPEAACVYCHSFDWLRNRPAETPGVFAGFSAGGRHVNARTFESAQSQL